VPATQPVVVVVGDANPDLVLAGDVVPRFGQAEQLLDDAQLLIGGSGAITAHGLARLGLRVGLVAQVGEDAFGDLMLARMEQAGVGTDLVRRADLATGLSVVLSTGSTRTTRTTCRRRPGCTSPRTSCRPGWPWCCRGCCGWLGPPVCR